MSYETSDFITNKQCRDWMESGMDYPWSSIWNPLELESALIPWISNSIWKIHGIHG
jgi:hypothetical protein